MAPEIISVGTDTPASFIVLAIAAKHIKDPEFQEEYKRDGGFQVELLINGKSVPVVETLVDIYERLDKVIDKRARKMALQMVTEAGLDPIAEALRDAERTIRTRLKIWEDI